jgi:hypothetical protein
MPTTISPNRITGAIWLIAAVIGIHLAFCYLPFINQEWAFSDAARYFEARNEEYIERYFSIQANTLGIPLLAFLAHKIMPFLDIGVIPRLLAISGFVFLGAALLRLNRLLDSRVHPVILLAVVFLNPLVWTFGGRGTADLLPASLALLGVVLFWERPRGIAQLGLASAIFSVAITLKYHTALLLPLIWLEALSRPQAAFGPTVARLSVVAVAMALLPIGYLLAVRHSFGFWVTPPDFQDQLSLTPDMTFVIENFSGYTGHLLLLAAPLSIFLILQQIRSPRDFALLAGLATGLFLLGFFFLTSNGEMNFGPLDPYLDSRVLSGVFLASLCVFLPIGRRFIGAFKIPSEASRLARCFLLGALVFIGVLSLSRPAQRYLLFLLPLGFCFILPALRHRKTLIGITLAFYILFDIYIGLSQYATGRSATELTEQIIAANLLEVTHAGALAGHTGNRFPLHSAIAKKYIVVAGKSPRQILYAESQPLPFVRKAFSVVPIE